MKHRIQLLVLGVSLCCAPALAFPSGTVWVVDDDGPADFAAIQPAVDAAAPGDLVLVKPGLYPGFQVAGKPLSITGDAAAPIAIDGLVRLRDVLAGDVPTVSNLQLMRGLRVHDCAGEVRLADCTIMAQGLCYENALLGSHQITDCESVVLTRVDATGRQGGEVPDLDCFYVDGLVGETGLSVTSSRVALYSCLIQGGEGGDGQDGGCLFCIDGWPGDGGVGLYAQAGATVYADDSVLLGGVGAPTPTGCDSEEQPSENGEPVVLDTGAVLEPAADPVLAIESPTLVREDEQLPVVVHGPVGSTTWMIWSDARDWRPFGGSLGILHCQGAGATLQSLGAIPGSGVLDAGFDPPGLGGGQDARRVYIQVFAIAPGVGRILGTPSSLDVVDPAF